MDGESLNRDGSSTWQIKKNSKMSQAAAELGKVDAAAVGHAQAEDVGAVSDIQVRRNVLANLREEEKDMRKGEVARLAAGPLDAREGFVAYDFGELQGRDNDGRKAIAADALAVFPEKLAEEGIKER
jgi:hypothetical protein